MIARDAYLTQKCIVEWRHLLFASVVIFRGHRSAESARETCLPAVVDLAPIGMRDTWLTGGSP
jgi:hypothetical protein